MKIIFDYFLTDFIEVNKSFIFLNVIARNPQTSTHKVAHFVQKYIYTYRQLFTFGKFVIFYFQKQNVRNLPKHLVSLSVCLVAFQP